MYSRLRRGFPRGIVLSAREESARKPDRIVERCAALGVRVSSPGETAEEDVPAFYRLLQQLDIGDYPCFSPEGETGPSDGEIVCPT